MTGPVVGVSCYLEPAQWGAWSLPAALLPEWYLDLLREAGAQVVLLPPGNDAPSVVDRIDALVLAGGADIGHFRRRQGRAGPPRKAVLQHRRIRPDDGIQAGCETGPQGRSLWDSRLEEKFGPPPAPGGRPASDHDFTTPAGSQEPGKFAVHPPRLPLDCRRDRGGRSLIPR